MQRDDPTFSSAVARLLEGAPAMGLTFAPPRLERTAELEALTTAQACGGRVADESMARCLLSGLWLRFDFFEQSHELSQSIETPTGSYWHAILHRREPDASNAGYWFRRVGEHPIFAPLSEHSATISPALFKPGRWDPYRFADLCDRATPRDEAALRKVQEAEWTLLMDFCRRRAVGE
jgi:hypothetical protein